MIDVIEGELIQKSGNLFYFVFHLESGVCLFEYEYIYIYIYIFAVKQKLFE